MQANRYVGRQADKHAGRYVGRADVSRQSNKQTFIQTDRLTNRQICRKTYRQADI